MVTLSDAIVDRAYRYTFVFEPRGAANAAKPTWRVASGALPEGLRLDERSGELAGRPEHAGEYSFEVESSDAGVREVKRCRLTVHGLLEIAWKTPPQVSGNTIVGDVVVSNLSDADDFDLTVFIVAVAENGRATSLAYQHFKLAHGAGDRAETQAIAFGKDAMPGSGRYIVHADAVAEVPSKNQIHRARVQSPPLTIATP